jgi:hypothetical protein
VDVVKIHPAVSLAVIVAILAVGVVASVVKARRDARALPAPGREAPAGT